MAAKKKTPSYPKRLVDAGGWHEPARDEEEEASLKAKGFRVVGDPTFDEDGNLTGWTEPKSPYAEESEEEAAE